VYGQETPPSSCLRAQASEENRRELQRRLNQLRGVSIPDDSLTKYPQLRSPWRRSLMKAACSVFKLTKEWVFDQAAVSSASPRAEDPCRARLGRFELDNMD
jgi:hypothetical protein